MVSFEREYREAAGHHAAALHALCHDLLNTIL